MMTVSQTYLSSLGLVAGYTVVMENEPLWVSMFADANSLGDRYVKGRAVELERSHTRLLAFYYCYVNLHKDAHLMDRIPLLKKKSVDLKPEIKNTIRKTVYLIVELKKHNPRLLYAQKISDLKSLLDQISEAENYENL